MFKQICNYFDNHSIDYQLIEKDNTLIFGIKTESQNDYLCILSVIEKESFLVFYSILQNISIPKRQRNKIAIFLTEINYGLLIGNYEMDFSDGEIRFKTSIDFEGIELTDAIINNIISSNLSVSELFSSKIIAKISNK